MSWFALLCRSELFEYMWSQQEQRHAHLLPRLEVSVYVRWTVAARSLYSFESDPHSAHARCGFLGTLCFVPDVWGGADHGAAAAAVSCLLHGAFLHACQCEIRCCSYG